MWSYTYTKAEYVLQDNSVCSIQGLDHQPSIKLGGGFKYFLFSPLFEEMIPIDKYFSNGLKPPTRKLMKHIPPPQLSVPRVGSTSAGTRYRHFGFQSDGGLLWQLPGAQGCFGMRLEEMPRSWTQRQQTRKNGTIKIVHEWEFPSFFEEPVFHGIGLYFTIIIMFVTISTPRKTKKTLPLKNSRWKTILSFSKWPPF